MTIYEFAKLGNSDKTQLINRQATFIDEYDENESRVTIYKLSGFVVEVVIGETSVDITPFKLIRSN